ncbi:7TM diverse intracellular signaling domain-containing protein [Wenyingzhuangia sp. IMCC45533]
MKKVSYLLFYIFITLTFSSCIQSQKEESLDYSVFYLADFNQKEALESVTTKEWKPLVSSRIGHKNCWYWFKIDFEKENWNHNIVFNIPEANIANITIYQNNKVVSFQNLENSYKSLHIKNASFKHSYYLKVLFTKEVYFPIHIKPYVSSQLQEKYYYFANGYYYGFVMMILIVNLFFYFSLQDQAFLYYGFFLVAITLGLLGYDGLLNKVFPPYLLYYESLITHFLVPLCGALFANQFLNIKYYLPKSNYVGFILLMAAFINYLLYIPTEQFLFVAIADTISLLILLYYWCVGVVIFKKHDFAKFFVIGYCLILFSAFLFILPRDWGFQHLSVSSKTIKVGAVLEMLILTYAITYRVKILQKENDQFKREIQTFLNKIKELESSDDSEQHPVEFDLLITKHDLSERETEVLLLIYKGYTNKRIADELFVSLNTVKYHIRNIYQKLNIKSKNEVIDIVTKSKK